MRFADESGAALMFLAMCAAKATVLLVAGWLLAAMLRGQSAAVRHRVWAAALLSALALPAFAMVLPGWRSRALGSAAMQLASAKSGAAQFGGKDLPAMVVDAGTNITANGKIAAVILFVWLAVATILLLRLAVGMLRLLLGSAGRKAMLQKEWMWRSAEFCVALKIAKPVRLLQCDNPQAMPLTWGFLQPEIVLPAGATEWPEARRRVVLLHELAHVARQDWLLQVCAELAKCLYWFHPLVWMGAQRLRQESERACDDAVLNAGVVAQEYAGELLDLARMLAKAGRDWSVAFARPSTLERRFVAMLNPAVKRNGISGRVEAMTVIAALLVLLPLAALRVSAQNAGSLTGEIHDPSGAGVKNATVIATNAASKAIVMTATDANGNFAFKGLAGGEYDLAVMKHGFETHREARVAVDAGREVSKDVELNVAATAEQVDVVASQSDGGAKEARRIKVAGEVEAANVINKVVPQYPPAAKSAGVQGTVVLRAVISMEGKPLSLRVMNEQVDPLLARSAVEAVSQWRYKPTLLNGQPIEVDTTIMVNYTLVP